MFSQIGAVLRGRGTSCWPWCSADWLRAHLKVGCIPPEMRFACRIGVVSRCWYGRPAGTTPQTRETDMAFPVGYVCRSTSRDYLFEFTRGRYRVHSNRQVRSLEYLGGRPTLCLTFGCCK